MNYKIVNTFPHEFFKQKRSPHVSIYQATSRYANNNKHDTLTFKGLIESVETDLLEKYDKNAIDPLVKLLKEILSDYTFWSNRLDGFALFATLDDCIIYNLKSAPTSIAKVSSSFHIKPLIKYYQFVNTYEILDLNGDEFKMLKGNAYEIDFIELDDVSTTKDDIIGTQREDSYETHGTYGGLGGTSMYHGHGGSKSAIELDLERFFRGVDTSVYNNVSKHSKMPLLLLAPKPYHTLFSEISNNIYLQDTTISGTYETLGEKGLKKAIKEIDKILFDHKMKEHLNIFNNLKADGHSSDELIKIISAAIDGRIESLYLQDGKTLPGEIDTQSKKIINDPSNVLNVNDIFDDLAQLTLSKGGKVYILDSESMTTTTGVAATFRY